ncbi:ChaN family lipoprotein [Loktanella sp. SALINAS62]|uniref:ChaN family lipoprotein n=1 Tax=Loktanella sp. SALINAS62 TaxID=2706124 RepID=UPI001B8C25DA|nr:ChaN family lipoprotein [Loktanella sp. SALINAS62]MBS1301261.1 ChaN family lipoprotein [Loktanella sp. SALINAS62]
MMRLLALLCCAAVPAAADVGPLPRADVYVLGEVHDNPAHHAMQAALVARIAPKALVFEMITAADAAAVVDITDADALADALRWDEKGWPDFTMYHPIFLAAPAATIVGADVARDDLMAAMASDAASVLGVGTVGFNLWPRSGAVYDRLVADQRDAHCGMLPDDMLPGMVEAQRLRDATLALAARDANDDTGGPVVVITGNGHARTDTGVPALLAQLAPDLTVWSLGQLEAAPDGDAPFDAVNVTDPFDRPDPCLTLAR